MRRARWIVAAALAGGALTTLTVATLALGAAETRSALVTLQVAPRGPGSVSAVPTSAGDTQPCTGNDAEDDCEWSYEQGTSVRLNAIVDAGAGKSFFGWSEPECGTNSSCTVRLDDTLTSVVAVFAPLMLAVKFSDDDGGATVSANPAGQPCDPAEEPGDAVFCRAYPPRTRVALTLAPGTTPFRGWNEQGDYLCEPTTATTCTIAVEDQPTWAGARFANEPPPQLPTTISVEFKLRKSGNGSGRVTASKLDCGTVCTVSYGYGKPIALTANPDDGSLFDGWNGVCARTQLTCSFPAGPITSIRAVFNRDAIAPTVPGAPVVGSRTRTSLAISWAASTDNVRVSGYRVYVDNAAVGETQATEYTLQGLRCGRRYAVAVDAVDTLGNRSQRASVTAETQPCALAARLAGVGIGRAGGNRVVVATVRVNRATTARLRLLRGGRTIATGRYGVKPGANKLRLRVPRSAARGAYRLATTLVNPDGGTLALPGRGVLLPRP
jgi:Divergent InlB B-repeat domain